MVRQADKESNIYSFLLVYQAPHEYLWLTASQKLSEETEALRLSGPHPVLRG